MKILLLFGILISFNVSAQNLGPDSKLKDLDSVLPGVSARLFAQGKVSTPLTDWGITLSPDCDEIYYTASIKNLTKKTAVVFLKWTDGKWSGPEVASFSGEYDDMTPTMSSDGQKIVFLSKRPIGPGDTINSSNFWCVERKNGQWSQPYLIKELYKALPVIFFPFMAKNGDLYFNSLQSGNKAHIFLSKYIDGTYQKPEPLKGDIVTEYGEYCPYVSPDQKWMIIEIENGPDGMGGGDMYISRKQNDSTWGKPVHLGGAFNSDEHDCYPVLTPGGNFLIYISCREPLFFGDNNKINYEQLKWMSATYNDEPFDFYWISASALDKYLKLERQ